MKRAWKSRVTFTPVCLILLLLSFAAPADAQTYEVLLVGDSWGFLMNSYGVFDTVFAANGRSDLQTKGDTTTINGSRASDWVDPANLLLITNALDANPSVEVVQLYMGGNDFLTGMSGGGWYHGMTSVAEDLLFASVVADIETVIDHILAHKPSVHVVIGSYDYSNFVESLSGPAAVQCIPYFNDLGQPTPEQVNSAGIRMDDLIEAMVATKPQAASVRNWGLMHWTFGYPSQGILPGTLPMPGDITLPSPPQAMLLNIDCTHLNSTGYSAVVQNLWDQFYDAFFNTIFADGFESSDTSKWSNSVN